MGLKSIDVLKERKVSCLCQVSNLDGPACTDYVVLLTSNNSIRFVFIRMLSKQLNLLKPNDIYICRTAALTSRHYILNIYLTNIHTEYFKHAA